MSRPVTDLLCSSRGKKQADLGDRDQCTETYISQQVSQNAYSSLLETSKHTTKAMSPISKLVSYASPLVYLFLCTLASPAAAIVVTQIVEIDGQLTTRTATQDSTGLLGITFTGSFSRTTETPIFTILSDVPANPVFSAEEPDPTFEDTSAAELGTGVTVDEPCLE